MKFIIKILATWGLGLLPKAPGTWGTLGGVLLFWLTAAYGLVDRAIILVVLSALGWLVCNAYTEQVARHDAPEVIIDEIAGYYLAILFVPFNWMMAILAFVIFRFFDIYKPWPIYKIDNGMHTGFGMMLDDIVAGIFSCGFVTVIYVLFMS